MDRALLERMVGAVVLVLLLVVFAPMLLDGSDSDAPDQPGKPDASGSSKRTEVIVLNNSALKAAKPAAQQKPARPVPKITAKPAGETAVKPKRPSPKPVTAKATATPEKISSQPPAEGFAVQLASFSSRDNATAFASKTGGRGYRVFVIKGAGPSGAVYRVYVGPEKTRPAAETLAAKLAKEGESVLVVDLTGKKGG